MPGLPPKEYDPGFVCESCFLLDKITPTRLFLEFRDVYDRDEDKLVDVDIIVEQGSQPLPCFYDGADETFDFLATVFLQTSTNPPANMAIDVEAFGTNNFFSEFNIPPCTLTGTFENFFTSTDPPQQRYVDGTCKISPF